MQIFHVRYRNSQGVLMRIMNAVSRRGLEFMSVHAEAAAQDYLVTLLLDVTTKQVGQLQREWNSIVDVIEVRSSVGLHEHKEAQWAALPPAATETSKGAARAALA